MVGKDLILVVVDHDVVGARCQDIIPECAVLKGIMDHDWRIADFPHLSIAILGVLYHSIGTACKLVWQGLVD